MMRRKLLASAVALMAGGLYPMRAQRPEFDVASIKRNLSGDPAIRLGPVTRGTFRATNIPLQELITMAYRIRDFQLAGAPGWLRSERYDVEGKAGDGRGFDELTAMLQPLLEKRLRLRFHRETKEMPVYSLVVAKAGKLTEAEGECSPPPDGPANPAQLPHGPCGSLFILPGHVMGQKVGMSRLAEALARLTARAVMDATGLRGKYDVSLTYTPESLPLAAAGAAAPDPPPGLPPLPPIDPNAPSLFTAIQDQLGLKLESQRGPVTILVIDQVERPSKN